MSLPNSLAETEQERVKSIHAHLTPYYQTLYNLSVWLSFPFFLSLFLTLERASQDFFYIQYILER
jgi:hypothetical protein